MQRLALKKILFTVCFTLVVTLGSLTALWVVHAATPALDVGLNGDVAATTGLATTDVRLVVARIIRTVLGLLGIIALVIVLYGGFSYMTAGGDDEKVGSAKKILVNGGIGLLIILSSYAITSFVISRLVSATTGVDNGQNCTGPNCTDGSGGSGTGFNASGNAFYVSSLPSNGNLCIRNVHPSVVFSKEVDIATLSGNVVVSAVGGSAVSGKWEYGTKKAVVFFVPVGDCAPSTGQDCLLPKTSYTITFQNPSAIKSADGTQSLNCSIKGGCGPVTFTTGEGVDRLPPQITITEPLANASFQAGVAIPVTVSYTDDNGIQNVSVYQGAAVVGSKSVNGCQKTGSVELSWVTGGLDAGAYTLQALGTDWSGGQDTKNIAVNLKPNHCFNNQLEADLGEKQVGPTACGGECGSCAGESCTANADCGSGFCQVPAGGGAGVCIQRTTVNGLSPNSGAPGTFVTVSGKYFGSTGRIYFAAVANPNITKETDWVEAKAVSCGAGFNSWSSSQIIVEVPANAVPGPVAVFSGAATLKAAATANTSLFDTTRDAWGPLVGDFTVNDEVHPSICALNPAVGKSGSAIALIGKNFGLLSTTANQVTFGTAVAVTRPNDWVDALIKTTVPNLEQGTVTVRVTSNGRQSNAVTFSVQEGASETAPFINTISTTSGARGEYITISGRNFGSKLGAVWFKAAPTSEAILGSFDFPDSCQAAVWRDDQIIVKFPLDKGSVGTSYLLQIKTADDAVSAIDSNTTFALIAGTPNPGICKISPLSGTVPFAAGQVLTLSGEYFGTQPGIYFWKASANTADMSSRALTAATDITSRSNSTISLRPPAGAQTGPVVVVRGEDSKVSNPINFTVGSCVQNNNTCPVSGYTCCSSGADAGSCKPAGELCSQGVRSAGYVWRFSSAAIPVVPHVVERCDAGTDQGRNLPSPSPSIQWDQSANGDSHNVCRTALATVELTALIDQKTVTKDTVIVNKCSGVDEKNNCLNPVRVDLTTDSYGVKTAMTDSGGSPHAFLQVGPATRSWEDNTWYQVALTSGIRSAGSASSTALALAADRPCQIAGSAYCYVFKTDTKNCALKAVVVTPYSYWTKVLESPIKLRTSAGSATELYYRGNGLSNQRCIMMDVSGFNWQWNSENTGYAAMYGSVNAPVSQVSALANTVAIGLTNPDEAINIVAVASTGTASYAGKSPLTIDLSDPGVVDYWPRCLEACTNAEVAVRFNTTMSLRNLPGTIQGGSVQLLKCTDENCLSTQSVVNLNDITLDPTSNYSVLKIANSLTGSQLLEPNTLYKVVVSTASTDPAAATNQLWSAAKLNDPQTSSKPFNQEFTWRFRTKNGQCQVDKAVVNPPEFFGKSIAEKTVYTVQPYAAPDSCSTQGQKLNPWSVSWNWSSADSKVASVTSFSTKGNNPSCTPSCIRKGSDVPATQANVVPVCGNGKVEAGEDCDGPDSAKGCALNCLFAGNTAATCGNGIVEPNLGEACDPKDPKTATGCSLSCRHLGSSVTTDASNTNASICGNSSIGSGEDCDTGITKSVANPLSQLNCSQKCLHTGSRLSKQWCIANALTRGGFSGTEFDAACGLSFSQCGDRVLTPDEDSGCDDPNTGWNSGACTQYCLKKTSTECVPGTEGCDANGRHTGSSLLYSTPSSCGDGTAGTGEDAVCETGLVINHSGLIDPWTLATGVGLGTPKGVPAAQTTFVKAVTNQNNRSVSGSGVFSVACGYQTDLDCKRTFGSDYSVGENTCCYRKPGLISTYPANNAATVCPNTYLEAVFDSKIDENTLTGNVLIARGGNTTCAAGQQDVTNLIARTESYIALPWYKKVLAQAVAAFKNVFLGSDVAALVTPVTNWCVGQDIGVARVAPVVGAPTSTSRISIQINTPLAFTTDYAVILKEGVKDTNGVSIGKLATKNISWHFSTSDKICEVNKVTVNPPEWSFSVANATTTLEAAAFTSNGSKVQPIPGFYDWQYRWGPIDNPYVSLQTTNTTLNVITAQNRNGEIDLRAEANITTNKYTSATGPVATGSSHEIVFLCENPWPPKSIYIDNQGPFTIFPYQDKAGNNDGFDLSGNVFNNSTIPASMAVMDGYFNFGTYYCADNGATGTADDLPYLRPTVQTSGTAISATGALKKFFFTNDKNADAIGIQVFANPKHLSPTDWYSLSKANGGQGFIGSTQSVKVDGYNAITDGNNIYVDALNYSAVTKNIYSTIYLFSINANADASTRKVFEQLLTNLNFNSNISNYGYCGTSVDNPGFQTQCQSDIDCNQGQVCSNSIDKLKRNYDRLHGLNAFQVALASYAAQHDKKYPSMQEGSYLTGQTVSTWPSWATLGNTLGQSAPVDPINRLTAAGTCSVSTNKFCTVNADCGGTETCVLHDPITAWSATDRRFSFACPPASYAYRYAAASAGANYTVRARFENTGLSITNQAAFMADFIDPTKFITDSSNGICNQDQEIASLNTGVCGDGVVNTVRGEQCDPVGQTRYGACNADQNGKIKVDVCDSSCRWKAADTAFVDCSFLSKCGNGAVEVGEKCDDGKLNGRYNHCTTKCTLPTKDDVGFCGDGVVEAKYEVCDIRAMMDDKPGLCVGGVRTGQPCSVSVDCNAVNGVQSSYGGVCKLITEAKIKYAQTKSASCNWDCQSTGPYCGDGIVQSDWGEDCDGATSACTVGDQGGKRSCSTSCKWTDPSAVAWWRFDEASLKDDKMTFSDASGINKGVCDGAKNECPVFTNSGKYNGAFIFSGGNFVTVPHYTSFDVANVTLEAWIKLIPGTAEGWKNILLKQNGLNAMEAEKDYNFSYYNTDKILKLGFSSPGRFGKAEGVLPTGLSAGEWHHVAVTVANSSVHAIKFYVDGKPLADGNISMSDAGVIGLSADRNYPVYLGGNGGVDELKVYDRVLTSSEVAAEAQSPWFCALGGAALAVGDGPRCGDAKVDTGEACDKGAANGQSCNPSYGKTCAYCSNDCKNIIDVQAKTYCGDGVVQGTPFGNEICDMDAVSKSVYVLSASPLTENTFNAAHGGYRLLSCTEQPQDDYTQKKEISAPACGAVCGVPTSNCAKCGVDYTKGVGIAGELINVLSPTSTNPLLGGGGVVSSYVVGNVAYGAVTGGNPSSMDVYIGLDMAPKKLVAHTAWAAESDKNYVLKDPAFDATATGNQVKLNSYPLCSTGDPRYTLRLNGDTTHRFDFPVFAAVSPEQYDLVLSPVINNQVRPNDVRVVVSWVREAGFYGGFTVPLAGKGKTEGATFAGKLSSGLTYYNAPRINGIGYHGFGTTKNSTNEEAFFVNTDAKPYNGTTVTSEMTNDQYAFYVRTSGESIARYKTTAKLRVDVYFPENDSANNHFATPAMTFYMNSASPSDNPNANYWHVFNIKRATVPTPDPVTSRIIPVNKIVTESKFF